jgi:hypothetical protein
MSIDAYKVAVRISLVENVTRGLMMMSRHFRTTDAEARILENRLKSIGRMTLVGGALVGAGAFGLSMIKGPLEEAKKYQTELGRFATLGFGTRINAQADQYARGMQTVGTSTRENLALVTDAMAVFKNLDHAKMAAPIMAKMKFANEVWLGKEGGQANDRKLMDMLKVVEFRGGLSSDAEFKRQADYAQKVVSGSRGRVDPTMMLQALKTGGVALSRRSNEAFYLGGEPLMQEFGGSRYGTAAMSIYQNLVQSRGTVTAQQELYRLGLLDPSKVQFNKLGMLKKALPGSFVGSHILESEGELALLRKVLLPAFAAKGVTGDEGVIRELGMILGNRTGSGLMSRIYQQQPTIQRMVDANRNAYGIDRSSNAAKNTTAGRELDLEAKIATLKLHIGQAILPLYYRALVMTADILDRINYFSQSHPALFGGIIKLFAALSVAAVAGGSIMLLTAGIRALALIAPAFGFVGTTFRIVAAAVPYLASGLMMLGRALFMNPIGLVVLAIAAAAYVLYKNWKTVGPYVMEVWGIIKAVFYTSMTAIMTNAKAMWAYVGPTVLKAWSIIKALGTVVGGTFASIYLSVTGWLGKILDWVGNAAKLALDPTAPIRNALGVAAGKGFNAADVWAKGVNDRHDHPSPYIKPHGNKPIHVHTTAMLDGRVLYQNMTTHMDRDARRPSAGSPRFDNSRSPMPVALGFG